jgi:hypothetical protein
VVRLSNYAIEDFEAENELVFTDAALTFLYHVAYGKEIPVAYNGSGLQYRLCKNFECISRLDFTTRLAKSLGATRTQNQSI